MSVAKRMKKKQHIEEISIRSDEVQEILSHVPNWMIRWGITLILAIILLFFFLAWLIKYPDTIQGTATLTTLQPPVKLVTKAPGEIEEINYKKGQFVQKGAIIATIHSTLSDNAKSFLSTEIIKIDKAYKKDSLSYLEIPSKGFVFGDLQPNYANLITALKKFQYLINEDNITFNIQNLSNQIKNQKALRSLSIQQIQSTQKLIQNAKEKRHSDQVLYKKGVISRKEYYAREKEYQNSIDQLRSVKRTKINSDITITNLKKQLNDLKHTFHQKKHDLLIEIKSEIKNIKNGLSTWSRSYQLKAPISGRLSYLTVLSKNQYIKSGEPLFAVIPKNQNYIAHVIIPKRGAGKVEKGQKAMLEMANYPAREFGTLIGKVTFIAPIPGEKGYRADIQLPDSLVTSYGKRIDYSPEMNGTAKIITQDLRITDRIFNQFREIVSR